MNDKINTHDDREQRKPYAPPSLEFIGDLVDVVRSGNGKASINAPDGPDTRKPPGQ